MSKSSYLDNLIKGALPIIPRSAYLNKLWSDTTNVKITPMTSSIFDNLSNTTEYKITNSSYLNDKNNFKAEAKFGLNSMSKNIISKITLNDEYLPKTSKNKTTNSPGSSRYKMSITAPPDYMPASITRIRGSESKTIQILFPKSFSRSIQAAFAKENPVGSDTPIVAYSYTNAEQMPLEFDALADYLPEGYNSLNEYVEDIIEILKPKKESKIIYEPTVTVQIADITFSGICESVSINYDTLFNGTNNSSSSFVHAVISCNFTKLS